MIEIIGVDFYVFVGNICFALFLWFTLLDCIVWFSSVLGAVGFFRLLGVVAVIAGEVGSVSDGGVILLVRLGFECPFLKPICYPFYCRFLLRFIDCFLS